MLLTFPREKMYKSRFTQWGLRKNARRKGEGGQQSGREKRPIDRSRPLLVEHAGYLTPTVLAKTPRAMRSFTPFSRPVMTPPTLAIPERILGVIWDYFRGSFEAGTWVSNGNGSKRCISTKPIKTTQTHLNLLYDQCVLACRLFDRNSFQDAGKTLVLATAQIKEILLAEEPRTLITLFTTILVTHHRGRDEIAFAILRQFSAMAMTVLGDRHPICRISGWLSSMDPSRLDDIIDRCLSSVGDHFASLLCPMHYTALVARINSMGDGGESEEKLRDLLGKCENDLGLLDRRTFFVCVELSWMYYNNNKFTQAEDLGQKLLVRSQKLHSTYLKLHYDAEGLFLIALSQYALGERHSGELNLLDAIASKNQTYPGGAAYWLSILEEWQLEQGREDSAAETRERRWKLQETFKSDE